MVTFVVQQKSTLFVFLSPGSVRLPRRRQNPFSSPHMFHRDLIVMKTPDKFAAIA
jgi:hypothetical protein